MTPIENKITLGNVLSIIGTAITAIVLLVTVSSWSGKQEQRLGGFEKELITNQTALAGHENRIRAIEQSSARQDERLMLILDTVRKIEAKLERDKPTPPR